MNNKDYFMYLREMELQEQIEQEKIEKHYRLTNPKTKKDENKMQSIRKDNDNFKK